jgi:hypothetical protein
MRPHLAVLLILLLTYACASPDFTGEDRPAWQGPSTRDNGTVAQAVDLADDQVNELMPPALFALRVAIDDSYFSRTLPIITDRNIQKFSSLSRKAILLI